MTGLAAEFNGAKLWMNTAMAIFLWDIGTCPYTSRRSKTKYGNQQHTNTERRLGEIFSNDRAWLFVFVCQGLNTSARVRVISRFGVVCEGHNSSVTARVVVRGLVWLGLLGA